MTSFWKWVLSAKFTPLKNFYGDKSGVLWSARRENLAEKCPEIGTVSTYAQEGLVSEKSAIIRYLQGTIIKLL